MCIVSATFDHYGTGGPYRPRPNQPYLPPQPFEWPKVAPVESPWDAESLALLKAAMALLRKLDSKLGLPDCEDPKKAAWLKAIEDKVGRTHDEWGRKL